MQFRFKVGNVRVELSVRRTPSDTDQVLVALENLSARVAELSDQVRSQGGEIMQELDNVQAKIAAEEQAITDLAGAVTAAAGRVSATVTQLQGSIVTLQAQVAQLQAGQANVVDPAVVQGVADTLDAEAQKLAAIKASVDAIDAA